MERQKGGIGLRGPGETQLETDRRLIGIKVKKLKHQLVNLEKQRKNRRRARERSGMPNVSLIGYTNAGKSSIFNALSKSYTNSKTHFCRMLYLYDHFNFFIYARDKTF